MQRKRLSLLWIMLMLCVLLSFVAEAKTKKPSTKALKSAYKKYISKNISSQNDYRLYDLNKDGIKECIICSDYHPRYYRLTILTYKNKKVICMLSTNTEYEILFSKKKGQICISSSSGAGSYEYELYKVKAKKIVMVTTYRQKDDLRNYGTYYFYKGKNRISEKEFRSFENIVRKWKDIRPSKTTS